MGESSALNSVSSGAQRATGFSIQTTADIYAHLHLADLRDALRAVEEKRANRVGGNEP